MTRAIVYLVISGAIWLVEAFLFSRLLHFGPAEVVLVAVMYMALFSLAAVAFVRYAGNSGTREGDLARWRLLAAAPMVVVIIGSFVSLPLLVLVAVINSVT